MGKEVSIAAKSRQHIQGKGHPGRGFTVGDGDGDEGPLGGHRQEAADSESPGHVSMQRKTAKNAQRLNRHGVSSNEKQL